MTIPPVAQDQNTHLTTEAHERVVHRLQSTLDRVIRQRDGLLLERDLLTERRSHWFVDDGAGCCLACNTPERNARHSPRAVAR